MSIATLHIGDFGTVLCFTITENGAALNISDATETRFLFQKKNRQTFSRPAVFFTNGTDGKLIYIFREGELDSRGIWNVQAHLVFASGEWSSGKETFTVDDNIIVNSSSPSASPSAPP